MLNNKYRAHIYPDIADAVRAAAQEWVVLAAQAIAARGEFHVALSGGTTPRALYQCLASTEFSGACDWQHVHIWFGDERAVPPQHSDSNYHMAHEALLRHVPVPLTHIHRMQGEQGDAHQAARAYQAQLVAHMPLAAVPNATAIPQFDLMLLGLGPDGHIASLFPDTPILALGRMPECGGRSLSASLPPATLAPPWASQDAQEPPERTQWVAAVFVEKLNTWRISLTLPVIDNARHIMLLVTGAGKAGIVGEIFAAPPETGGRYPVEMINPGVAMDWYLDSAAAQYIVEPTLCSTTPSVIKDAP